MVENDMAGVTHADSCRPFSSDDWADHCATVRSLLKDKLTRTSDECALQYVEGKVATATDAAMTMQRSCTTYQHAMRAPTSARGLLYKTALTAGALGAIFGAMAVAALSMATRLFP